jgi:hypothetical protein
VVRKLAPGILPPEVIAAAQTLARFRDSAPAPLESVAAARAGLVESIAAAVESGQQLPDAATVAVAEANDRNRAELLLAHHAAWNVALATFGQRFVGAADHMVDQLQDERRNVWQEAQTIVGEWPTPPPALKVMLADPEASGSYVEAVALLGKLADLERALTQLSKVSGRRLALFSSAGSTPQWARGAAAAGSSPEELVRHVRHRADRGHVFGSLELAR